MRKKLFITILIPVVLTIFVVGGRLYKSGSSRELTVTFDHIKSVTVLDTTNRTNMGEDKKIARINRSGERVQVPKKSSILLVYSGMDGYRSGVASGDKPLVNIQPEFSDKKIEETIKSNWTELYNTVYSSIQNDNLYQLDQGTLYDYGEWYLSVLHPVDDSLGLDSLVIILKKSSNGWRAIASPQIIYNTYNAKDVPVEVIRVANRLKA